MMKTNATFHWSNSPCTRAISFAHERRTSRAEDVTCEQCMRSSYYSNEVRKKAVQWRGRYEDLRAVVERMKSLAESAKDGDLAVMTCEDIVNGIRAKFAQFDETVDSDDEDE